MFKKKPAALEDHSCKSSKNNYPGNSPTSCLLWMAFYLVVTNHTSNSMSCRPILFGFISFTVSNVLPLVSLKPPENETRESPYYYSLTQEQGYPLFHFQYTPILPAPAITQGAKW
jgi:hypothetical protein